MPSFVKKYKDIDKLRRTRNKQRKRYYNKTINAKNQWERWTDEHLQMVLEHKLTDTEISKKIGRSVSAIQQIRWVHKRKQNNEKMRNM